jgi:hypothetical protein
MGRLLVLASVAMLLAAQPAGAASSGSGYSFGRISGNIVPFTVTISASGAVHAAGPVTVGRTKLSASQLKTLAKVAAQTRFGSLPATTACSGTLPDIAATWIRAGGHRVQVHGACSAAFTRLWNALGAAVRLSTG